MIDEKLSDTVESLLHQFAALPECERTTHILFLSTYLMNHGGLLLASGPDQAIAQRYMDLTRHMEGLLQSHRQHDRRPGPPKLRVVRDV